MWKVWFIQNPVEHLCWSVLQRQLTATIMFANYNCGNTSFSRSLLHEKI